MFRGRSLLFRFYETSNLLRCSLRCSYWRLLNRVTNRGHQLKIKQIQLPNSILWSWLFSPKDSGEYFSNTRKSTYERSNIYQQNSCGFFIRESQGDLKIDILNWDTFSRLSRLQTSPEFSRKCNNVAGTRQQNGFERSSSLTITKRWNFFVVGIPWTLDCNSRRIASVR